MVTELRATTAILPAIVVITLANLLVLGARMLTATSRPSSPEGETYQLHRETKEIDRSFDLLLLKINAPDMRLILLDRITCVN